MRRSRIAERARLMQKSNLHDSHIIHDCFIREVEEEKRKAMSAVWNYLQC